MAQINISDAKEWYKYIVNMVEVLRKIRDNNSFSFAETIVEESIRDSAFAVGMRSDWHTPGYDYVSDYRILLAIGVGEVHIVGELDKYNCPISAAFQRSPNWGTSWINVPDCNEGILLDFARCFCFK